VYKVVDNFWNESGTLKASLVGGALVGSVGFSFRGALFVARGAVILRDVIKFVDELSRTAALGASFIG